MTCAPNVCRRCKRSNQPLSEWVADILAKALDGTVSPLKTEERKALRILEEQGLLGCMEGNGQFVSLVSPTSARTASMTAEPMK